MWYIANISRSENCVCMSENTSLLDLLAEYSSLKANIRYIIIHTVLTD